MTAFLPLLPYVGVLVLVVGLWGTHKFQVWDAHRKGVNEGRAEITAQVEQQRIAQEAENARIAQQAQAATTAAETAVRAADARAAQAQADATRAIQDRLAALRARVGDPRLGVRDGAGAAPAGETPRSAAGADGASAGADPAGRLAGCEADRTILIDTIAVNNGNHARCTARLEGWQGWYRDLQRNWNKGG